MGARRTKAPRTHDKGCTQSKSMGWFCHGHSPSDRECPRLNLGRTKAEIKHLQSCLVSAHRQLFKREKAIACTLGTSPNQSKKANNCVFGSTKRPQIKGLLPASVLEANKRHAQPGDFRCVPKVGPHKRGQKMALKMGLFLAVRQS